MHTVCAILIYQPESGPALGRELAARSQDRIQQLFPDTPIYANDWALAAFPQDNQSDTGSFKIHVLEQDLQPAAALKAVAEALQLEVDAEADQLRSIAILPGWSALLDKELYQNSLQRHARYLAHFTYGENIPSGLIPELASLEFVHLLPADLKGGLREHAFKNIDKYDVELFYHKPDLRQLRLDLSCAGARSQRLVTDLIKAAPEIKYNQLEALLQNNPDLLRPFPSCIEIELSGQRQVEPIYLPEIPAEHIAPRALDKLIAEIEQNALEQDLSLILGGAGDALFYPRLADYLQKFLNLKSIQHVYLETYATNLDESMLAMLEALEQPSKLKLIIRAGAFTAATRAQVHGTDASANLIQIVEKIESVLQGRALDAGPAYYIEFLRMQENDHELDAFMRRFKDSPVKPLVGKYNRFIDLLPERRALDLTPLQREFCWHLARDVYLNLSVTIPLCKQDPRAVRGPAYDFMQGSLMDYLNKSASAWQASFAGKHEETGMPCTACDEWYTFNA